MWFDEPNQYQHPGLRAAAEKAKREATVDSRTEDAIKFASALKNIDASDLAMLLSINLEARDKIGAAM